jgi:hypothetical protein
VALNGRLTAQPEAMPDEPLSVVVECYAGYRGEQTPRALTLHGSRIELVSLIDQWLAPDHRYFKAADSSGDIYILRHDISGDRWELTLFQRGSGNYSAPRDIH